MDPTDAELDAYILTRLRLKGVNLDVLPEHDPAAPADRRRILASARTFLRTTVADIERYPLPVEGIPPILYPGHLARRSSEDPR